MTILQALNSYYSRMGDVAPRGYSAEKVSYAIILSPDGDVVGVNDIRDTTGKKPMAKQMAVPAGAKRTVGIFPNRLWDKSAYVLGVTAGEGKRTAQEHAAFKEAHAKLLADTEDEGLLALQRFLKKWRSEQFETLSHFREEMKDANFVFQLDNLQRQYLHDRHAARALIAKTADGGEGGTDLCLVTGERGKAARLHPSIKGVWGAQSSGASLVSFNLNAFTSYGKDQGANAPVSEAATARYGAALNRLLDRDSQNRVQIGDTSTVFWADASAGTAAADAADIWANHFFEPPKDEAEAAEIRKQLEAVAKGQPVAALNPVINENTRFYILGLAPNAARLSVRFWHDTSFGALESALRHHWQDMAIDPPPKYWPPSAWHVLIETAAQHKTENIPPSLGGELMRAILNGTRYPRSLMSAVLVRIRAEKGEVTAMRAVILRGILARDHRLGFEPEEVPVALDENETNTAYRLGRWFAELEAIQQHALPGLNATIRDRFYGSASSAPARTFPVLIRNAMNHLSTLRKNGKAGGHEKRLEAIIAGVDVGLPRSLQMEDQARFAIGYYHQRAERFTKSTDTTIVSNGEPA